MPAQVEQLPLQLDGEGGLARPAQAGQPHHATRVVVELGALLGRDLSLAPVNVRALVRAIARPPWIAVGNDYPSSTYACRPRLNSSRSSSMARVDWPEPLKPVSHTTQPGWLLSSARCSAVTFPW